MKKRIKTEKLDKYSLLYPSVLEGVSDYNCPTEAISNGMWNMDRCIFCRQCDLNPTGKQNTYSIDQKIPDIFKKSLYLYPVDSGTCGACNVEFTTLFSPQYDSSRFKIFMASTPRHADALVVMGIYTEGMERVLREAYDAMPEPKIVIGLGACALSGGIMGKGAMEKYDIRIAGCPPTPSAILNAIIEARDKK
ncbi:NADH-quinone oxidoreductase subunit B family protein [Ferroplasma sp.]|uniref:NADH-quinone oxidoreductase subunit B family protein n=1 Tax=Ferroplasma sp. TaxID=2591003 RepID=UPI0035C95C7B